MRSANGPSPAFAETVKELLAGRSHRSASRELGVSHATLGDMTLGVAPSPRLLAEFADAIRADPMDRCNLFIHAGYREEERGAVCALLEGLRGMGIEVPEATYLTPETVSAVLRAVRERLK